MATLTRRLLPAAASLGAGSPVSSHSLTGMQRLSEHSAFEDKEQVFLAYPRAG